MDFAREQKRARKLVADAVCEALAEALRAQVPAIRRGDRVSFRCDAAVNRPPPVSVAVGGCEIHVDRSREPSAVKQGRQDVIDIDTLVRRYRRRCLQDVSGHWHQRGMTTFFCTISPIPNPSAMAEFVL